MESIESEAIQGGNNNLDEIILDLHQKLLEKDSEIMVLKNKLKTKENALELIENGRSESFDENEEEIDEKPQKNKKNTKTTDKKKSDKIVFFEEHQRDKYVLDQIVLFKTNFPGIKIPKQLIKSFTYKNYKT
jgi:hypothetical protein